MMENGVPMKASCAFLVLSLLIPASALAQNEPVSFPGSNVANSLARDYRCKDGKQVSVLYINTTHGDSLAYLPVDGKRHIFVAVMSGSGVRYASGQYIWWNKGKQGNLTRDGDNSAPPLLANCMETPG
jgi:membrane-bound inhibitor of C-type lysozyme